MISLQKLDSLCEESIVKYIVDNNSFGKLKQNNFWRDLATNLDFIWTPSALKQYFENNIYPKIMLNNFKLPAVSFKKFADLNETAKTITTEKKGSKRILISKVRSSEKTNTFLSTPTAKPLLLITSVKDAKSPSLPQLTEKPTSSQNVIKKMILIERIKNPKPHNIDISNMEETKSESDAKKIDDTKPRVIMGKLKVANKNEVHITTHRNNITVTNYVKQYGSNRNYLESFQSVPGIKQNSYAVNDLKDSYSDEKEIMVTDLNPMDGDGKKDKILFKKSPLPSASSSMFNLGMPLKSKQKKLFSISRIK